MTSKIFVNIYNNFLFLQMGVWSYHVYIVRLVSLLLRNCYKLNHFRLVGCPPFWHRKQMIMLRNIMEGKYTFSSPEWADISGL